MPKIISTDNFIVNVAWPQEFGQPLDLEKVVIISDEVRGKSGIYFISIENADSLYNDWKGETVDSWTFMNEIHRDEAFKKLIKLKYDLS